MDTDHGKRGAQPLSANIAIAMARSLRLLFDLPLRQTEGFLRAILQRMGLELSCPDHPTWSRRHATGAIRQQGHRAAPGPGDLRIDSTGWKGCGQGAWHSQQHGEKQGKRWKKRPIGVDNQGWIITSCVPESPAPEPSQGPERLSQVDPPMHRFVGEGSG